MKPILLSPEWNDRLAHWIRVLTEDFYQPLGEIHWEIYRTYETLSPAEAEQRTFTPITPGDTWGNQWEYGWFRGDVVLPEAAQGQRIVLDLHPNGESTLYVNGEAFGTYRSDRVSGVDAPHHFLVDNDLTVDGQPGARYHILMETYAGDFHPGEPSCGVSTGPVLPGTHQDTAVEGQRRTLGHSTYGIWNEAAYQLYLDVTCLRQLLAVLNPSSLRAAKIRKALKDFTTTVDFEQPRDARIASYEAARALLRPVLQAKNGDTMPVFYAIGNAHLDLAWLWPMAETIRKTCRTFAAQLRLLEENPEYLYLQSQPAAYEMCRQYNPALFARIREAVKQGRWIAEGAMWVEPDTNMTGGEALIRQLLYGKRWYREALGVDSQILWLPDTFGYSAVLPQILQGCGVHYLVTQKIFWSYNGGEQFPYHYFTWEGMDGSQITSFLPTSYMYATDPKSINDTWNTRVQADNLDAFLLPFGYGDGGGGPCRDHIEYLRRQKDLEGGARVIQASPVKFFEDLEEAGGPVNQYTGELYFTAHRGTYTSQAKIKENNRRCEIALREMEFWSCQAAAQGFSYDQSKAEKLWKELLLNQFHDILPGSSIARVCREAEQAVQGVIDGARAMTSQALAALVSPDDQAVTAFNSLSFARQALIPLPERFEAGAVTADGTPVPVGRTPAGFKALVTIPACGAVTLRPGTTSAGAVATATTWEDGFVLENQYIRAQVNALGEVTHFILRETGRDFAAAPLNHFRLYKDVPRLFDAWDIDATYLAQETKALSNVEVSLYSTGMEAAVRVTGVLGSSPFSQIIRLAADSRRLEFETEIDWRELHRLLKTAFPVDVYAENGINEIQFGYIQRPTHRSDSHAQARFEVCNHRYSALCDNSHGAALLNNSKYGISMNGNTLELSLLRAPAAPEMRADNRVHRFTYAFTAWEGAFLESDVVRQGYELNVPVQVVAGAAQPFRSVSIDADNIFLDTMKLAEDGSGRRVLRLYEAKKASVTAKIHVGCRRVFLCDMLEQKKAELPVCDGVVTLPFRAFEIKTLLLD